MDAGRIGIIGICGFGGMGLNAAAMDTRIKATVASTMYDMSRVNANGYFDAMNADARYEARRQLNEQRTKDAQSGTIAPSQAGLPASLKGNEPQFVKDYFDYYKTKRGFHPRSINSNGAWNATSSLSFHEYAAAGLRGRDTQRGASYPRRKGPFALLQRRHLQEAQGRVTRQLLIIPNASHTDLYDKIDVIPF